MSYEPFREFIPTPSGSAIVMLSSTFFFFFWHLTAPRFCLCPGLRDATSHLVKMANLRNKLSKEAPIGSRLRWQRCTLPFAACPAASCSLGRSAAQASCSRNLSKLDLRRGAITINDIARTCQAVGAMLVARRGTPQQRNCGITSSASNQDGVHV